MYYWQEKRGSPRDYYVVGRLKGFNVALDLEKQDDDVWDFWERNEQLYDCIIQYKKIIRMLALSFAKRKETRIVKLMRRVRRVRLKGSFR